METYHHQPAPDQLLRQARDGDEHALGTLLEAYRVYLELLARLEIGRSLQTKVDADDVIQETFLDAHRNFSKFRGRTEAEFAAWLRAILAAKISHLIRHYKAAKRRDVRREQPLEVDLNHSSQLLDHALVSAESTPSRQISKREQGVLVAQALSRLSPDYREVIILRHLEEKPFAEVAAQMNRSVDSVQKLWVRALARLKQIMTAGSDGGV